ncbi:glycoside hydrolase family 18 protein [Terriglobus saanensis]|uniref:chitinase n=1 Tax=Terriglobus saanensis (strain ATCC BAA-1853 / DSM 23119 / SP1PR4) TaxID=401053 RepID=E8V2A5_TERSS|nr:glycoside hydrolase family 18 protein [Terriglobus saanensis]ADV81238.1 Chitinase [Terriglobus saanensis SP1PR4]
MKIRTSLLPLLAGLLAVPCVRAQRTSSSQIIGYVFSRGQALNANDIAAKKLTRIHYAFIDTRDGALAEPTPMQASDLATLVSLKKINPALTIVVSTGGFARSEDFSDIALTPASRAKFVASCLHLVEAQKLDGIDIDWEYPAFPRPSGRFRAADKQNYTLLLRYLRMAFDTAGRRLHKHLVTSTATNGNRFFINSTELAQVAKYVDTIALMGYDYYDRSDPTTGNHSPLFTDPADPKKLSDDQSVRDYLAAGVPPEKIVLGVPFYGHGWTGVPPANHGLFQPVPKNKMFDVLYTEIAKEKLAPGSGFTRYWNAASAVPYLYNPATQTFITYDDPESMKRKCAYVREKHLSGIMFWAYNGDPDNVLLDAINAGLHATPKGK